MQLNPPPVLPVLAGPHDPEVSAAHLTDAFVGELTVAYTPGPAYGQSLLTWSDLDRLSLPRGQVRQEAAANLYEALDRVTVVGQPPALMLCFDGLESSVLLAHSFWDDLEGSVPGELVVGVPARDVVIFTGVRSQSGMQRVRRAVDRMFFAGGSHLLTQDLLVRTQRRWEVLARQEPFPDPFHSDTPRWGEPGELPPEHPSGEGYIPPVPAVPDPPQAAPGPMPGGPAVPRPRRPLSTVRVR